jgi:hypothetical protein
MTFDTIRDLAAFAGAILGAIGTWLGYRVAARAQAEAARSRRPTVVPTIAAVEAQPGWYYLSLSLRSRDNLGYRAEELRMKRPRRARLLNMRNGRRQDGAGGLGYANPLPVEKSARSVPARVEVRPAGTPRPTGSFSPFILGDTHYEEFLVWLPPSLCERLASMSWMRWRRYSVSLRMAFIVRSREAVSTQTVIAVKIAIARENTTVAPTT